MKKLDTIAAVVTKVPSPSSSFSSVGKVKIENEEMPMVAFNNLNALIKAKFFNLKQGQSIFISGRIDPASKMGKRVIAEDVHDAQEYTPAKELTVEETLSMPNEELLPLEERTLPDKKYSFVHPKNKETVTFWSDGIYFWLEGEKHDKKKMNFKFIENYNSCVTSDKALLPDWYTVQVAQNLIKEQQDNSKMAALLDDFATY